MKRKRTLLSYALLSLVVSAAFEAAIFVEAPDEYLVDKASVIVRAIVRPLERPPMLEGLPRTHYRLEVEVGLRGASAGDELEIAVPGGYDKAGRLAIVSGAPSFRDGEEALFFLGRGNVGELRPIFLEQGVYRFDRRNGQHLVQRRLGGEDRLRDLARFEKWIADRLAGQRRAEDYFVEEASGSMEVAAGEYNISTWYGLPVRWPKSIGRLNLGILLHEVGHPGIAGGGYGDVEVAFGAWNGVPGNLLNLYSAGITSDSTGLNSNDGVNTVVFADFGGSNGDIEGFDCTAGVGSLAYAISWVDGTHSYAGREFFTVVSADAVTTKNMTCWSGFNTQSFQSILAHEVGHMLGLGHACDRDVPCDDPGEDIAVMRNRTPFSSNGARLSEDDIRAIHFLYGPPNAPSYLRAEEAGAGRVELSWPDSSNNESGFRIYREENGRLEQIGQAGPGATGYLDDEARSATTYVYKVRAENENGLSAAAEATIMTADLAAPHLLRATEAGSDFLTLGWVDRANGETGFEIWGRFLGSEELLASPPANSTTATLTGLIADSTYHLKVRAIGLPSGNTAFSNTVAAGTLAAPVEPCEESGAATCLSAERFKVEVRWKDFAGNRGQGALAPAGSADSGVFYFFSPNNWEMLVKVLDGCAINQKTWVFAAATTDVETTLIVTDSSTGKTAVYFNPLGQASPAVTDIAAFEGCSQASTAAPKAESAAPLCADGSGQLCLLGGRYRVKVTWTDFAGQQGQGQAVPAGTGDSGLLYFFSPDNWEMLVKVLDGCAINGKVWVFAAATTNVAYALEVEDQETGLVRTYENLLGRPSVAITDIEAFSGCPLP